MCRYALEIATDEINHVADLRALLGADALPCPQLDIGPAFAAAVEAALGTQKAKDIPFSPYENDLFFLHGAPWSPVMLPSPSSDYNQVLLSAVGSFPPLWFSLYLPSAVLLQNILYLSGVSC